MNHDQFPNPILNGEGLQVDGLCFNQFFAQGVAFCAVDGLGLQTKGLVWSLNNGWANYFNPQQVTWVGCTGLCTLSG